MGRIQRSWRAKTALALGATAVAAALIFGSFGKSGGPLGVGETRVTAQPSGTVAGQSGTMQPVHVGPIAEVAVLPDRTAAQEAAFRADQDKSRAGMAARAAALPASDARVRASAAPPLASEMTIPRMLPDPAASPSPAADGDFQYFEANQLNPAAGGLNASSVSEPAVAQNGRYVFETWNWGAARSVNGGNTWSYISPYATMADFCCDQDVIYDKGRDRMYWLRQGLSGSFASPLGGVENRDLITVDNGAGALCTYDIRPSITGNAAYANTWFDYPRLALSNNFLYVGTNVFTNAGSYVTSFVIRFGLTELAGCGAVPFTWWGQGPLAQGWTPGLVENARETMFMGDQVVTNSGLNDQFRVYWIFDDSTALNFVDRTIAQYTFTNRNGTCIVPGGFNPCNRADQRVTGGAINHNTPTPAGLGAAGDRVDFYWNVKEGNGFALPYVESATFHAGTILYQQRKYIFSASLAWHWAAVGANDRDHIGLSVMGFWPAASAINPQHYVGLNDDYNGNPPGWEVYTGFGSSAPWTASSGGDYLRVRKHSPVGTAWIATGYSRQAGQYQPSYLVFGRARDLNGFNRFDQQ